jgi:peptide/nickel transport system permease protein
MMTLETQTVQPSIGPDNGGAMVAASRGARLPLEGWIGLVLVALLVLIALLAPVIAPAPPNEMDLLALLQWPTWTGPPPLHLLGTDQLGRDLLSRVVWGARIACTVAFLAAVGAAFFGSILGVVAGTLGGRTDWFISRMVELWMSFPPVVLSLLLLVALGTGIGNVVLAIVLVDWTRFCRIVRSEVMVIRRQNYVAAAQLIGFGPLRIMWREVVPGIMPTLITLLAMEMGIAIRVEAVLSFIGMSVPADVPTWGQMIADARPNMTEMPWAMLVPVAAILVTVIGFNLLGDGLRRWLDPRLLARGDAS